MPESLFTIDVTIYPRHFKADAWIIGERQRHHRVRDHFGAESDLYVVLSQDVGKYVAFTPIHWVMADLVSRLDSLENSTRVRDSFTADAWLATSGTYGRGVIFTAAVMLKTQEVTTGFTLYAYKELGGVFTADAIIMPSLTMNAFIV